MIKRLFLLLFAMVLFGACTSDDAPLENYVFSLAELTTNSQGLATSIALDNGETLPLSSTISGLKADTLYRIQALYVVQSTQVILKDYAHVLAPEVKKHSDQNHPFDPLNVTTYWKSAHYINLRLGVRGTTSGKHYFGFHQTNYVFNPDGSRTMKVHLVHNQNNDPLYYTRDTYISLPLRPLIGLLQERRDSLALSVTTFEGERTYRFAL